MEKHEKMMEEWQQKIISDTRKQKNISKEELLELIERETRQKDTNLTYNQAKKVIMAIIKMPSKAKGDENGL